MKRPGEDKKDADRATESRHPLKFWEEMPHLITDAVTNKFVLALLFWRGG